MRRYYKIESCLWNDAKFLALSHNGMFVFLQLLTWPHMTAVGAMRETIAGLAPALKVTPRAYRKALEELKNAGMVEYCEEASFIGLPNFLKHNAPANPNVVTHLVKCLDEVPECGLKDRLIERLVELVVARGKGFAERLPKRFAERLPKRFREGLPNQEQEQEQQQEHPPPLSLPPSLPPVSKGDGDGDGMKDDSARPHGTPPAKPVGWWTGHIDAKRLRNPKEVAGMYRDACKAGLILNSNQNRLRIVALSLQAIRADNPGGFFVSHVERQSWNYLTPEYVT